MKRTNPTTTAGSAATTGLQYKPAPTNGHGTCGGAVCRRLKRHSGQLAADAAGRLLRPAAGIVDRLTRNLPTPSTTSWPRMNMDGDFVRRRENLLVFGNPGSGKTHLLCAVGQELVRKHGIKVLFLPSVRLLQDLLVAKRDLVLPRAFKRLTSYDALIIDDIGYVQQSKEEVEVLFTLISECYERTSILLTSNLPFSQWEKIFKDPMMTIAAIDRLIHHSVVLEMNISSYRMENSRSKREAAETK